MLIKISKFYGEILKNLECLFLDPCNGVTCATGTVAVSALGICQCLEVRILQIRYALIHW